jgi:hypothetical protein
MDIQRSLTSCKQLVTDDLLHDSPWAALAEHVVTAIYNVDAATIAKPVDGRVPGVPTGGWHDAPSDLAGNCWINDGTLIKNMNRLQNP